MTSKNTTHQPDDSLEASYLQAEYIVFADDGDLTFRIGEASEGLDRILRQNRVHSACFITAANPGSILQSDQVNADAHENLIADITSMGYGWIPGVARDPQGVWPDEISILVLGASREYALAIAGRFGQFAIVWIHQDGLPGLLWVAPQRTP